VQYDPLSLAPDVPLIKMFILAGLFGIATLIVIAILIAVVARRPGLAAVFGGLVLLAIGFGLITSLVAPAIHNMQPSEVHHSIDSAPLAGGAVSHVVHSSYGRMSIFGMLVILLPAVVVALIIAGIVRGGTKKCEGSRRSGWPAWLFVPLIFLFVMGTVRFTKTTQISAGSPPSMELNTHPPAGEIRSDVHAQIDNGDIHMLMDKADAPRIALVAEAAAGVAAITETDAISSEAAHNVEAAAETEVEQDTTASELDSRERDAPGEGEEKLVANPEDTADKEAMVAAAKSTHADGNSDDTVNEKRDDEKSERPTDSTEVVEEAADAHSHSHDEPVIEKQEPTTPRPEWVSQQPARVGDAWQEVIVTDEYASEPECRRATDIYLLYKTYERFQTLSGRPFVDSSLPSITFNKGQVMADGRIIYDDGSHEFWNDSRLNQLLNLGIGIDYIRREIVDKQHMEQVERSFGPMYKMYTLVKFTPEVDAELRRHWAYYQRQDKFEMVGVGAVAVLGLLGFIYGLLKVDTLTKGYYTKRLFIGVPAAIIGGTVLFSLLVEVLT
jgi:hypothetical protein